MLALRPSSLRRRATALLAPLALLASATAQVTDPKITEWLTARSYARVYTTAANRASGSSATTWSGVTSPFYSDIQRVVYSNTYVYLYATGMPSYVAGNWLGPTGAQYGNWPKNRAAIHRIPRTPSIPATKQKTNGSGGVLLNGVYVWANGDAQSYDNTGAPDASTASILTAGDGVWNRLAGVAEDFNFDPAKGHHPPNGAYHNHVNPLGLRHQLGDHVAYDSSTKLYSEITATAPTAHSPLLGFANDGLPIYGPYGYSTATDASSGVRRMVSGFVKRNGQTTDKTTGLPNTNLSASGGVTGRTTLPVWAASVQGRSTTLSSAEYGPRTDATYANGPTTNPCSIGIFAEDYDYLGDLGHVQGTDFDLNRQNVRWCVTPEYPSGTYAYFVAIDAAGASVFPDIINQEYFAAAPAGQGLVTSISETVVEYLKGGQASALTLSAAASPDGSGVTLSWPAVEGATYTAAWSSDGVTYATLASNLSAPLGGVATHATATVAPFYKITLSALAAYDASGNGSVSGLNTSATATYSAPAVNTAPTLTTVSTLGGAVKNTAFTLPYATLAAAADEADAQGDAISFRIESVTTGALAKNGFAVVPGSTTLASGESLVWTPAADATGTLAAFTVRATDGSLASVSAVQVNITISSAVAPSPDALLSSWFTARTGRYARIVETDAELLADTTKTTWTRTSGPNTISQSSPAYAGPQQIDYSASWVYVRTPSLATYTMGPWYNNASKTALFVNVPKNQGLLVRFPRSIGAIPTTKTAINGLNIGGVMQPAAGYYVDGVALFDPTDGYSYANGTESSPGTGQWHRDAYANEYLTFDKSLAHQQNTGVYHNHANPIALRHQLGDHVTFNAATKTYAEGDTSAPSAHSPIIGWMIDGLPVYGPYGYGSALDAASPVRRMIGGFVLRDGATTGVDNIATAGRTIPAWSLRNGGASVAGPAVSTTYPLGRYVEDYAYLGDLIKTGSTKYAQGVDFDLDEYNVRYCVTPEFPAGTWAYFLNISAAGVPRFPYMVNRWFYGAPVGGKVNSVAETVTNHFSGGANRPLAIASATVAKPDVTLAWDAVEGATYAVAASADDTTYTTKASGIAVSNTNHTIQTYAALGSSGAEYARVTRTALAAYDTTGTVAATVSQTTTITYFLGAALIAPTISESPGSDYVFNGASYAFHVSATGSGPLSYQWYKNDAPVSGATAATYTIPSAMLGVHGGDYTVTVTNDAGAATSAPATLLVLENSNFTAWLTEYFTLEELIAGTVTAQTADPDADGQPNLLEHAFGLHPRETDASPITISVVSGHLQITFPRRVEDSGLLYTVEASSDLASWSSANGVTTELSATPIADTNLELVTVRDNTALTTRRFLRLRVELD